MNNGIFLLLGSNQGDRQLNLSEAKTLVAEEAGIVTLESKIYVTAAWGKTDQPDFYNQVIRIETKLSPTDLLNKVLAIEAKLGRKRIEKWGPRVIDIDVLFYNDLIIHEPDLVIPHPAIPLRKFTLMPLAEIAPSFIHPLLKKTVDRLLEECKDDLKVEIKSQ